METKANYVAVGGFVLVCMLGLVVTLLWLAGAQYSQEYVYFQTYFKGPVTGLGDGTTVRYNGIDVGRVTELKFDPSDPQRVIVKLQTKPDLHIRQDSEATIEKRGPDQRLLCRDQRRHQERRRSSPPLRLARSR